MVNHEKMPRSERAKQFAPFDALKGLQEAIKLKEYEHDKIVRGEMSEDDIKEISSVLQEIKNGDKISIEFFRDGHSFSLESKCKIDIVNQTLYAGAFNVAFDEIIKIKRLGK